MHVVIINAMDFLLNLLQVAEGHLSLVRVLSWCREGLLVVRLVSQQNLGVGFEGRLLSIPEQQLNDAVFHSWNSVLDLFALFDGLALFVICSLFRIVNNFRSEAARDAAFKVNKSHRNRWAFV